MQVYQDTEKPLSPFRRHVARFLDNTPFGRVMQRLLPHDLERAVQMMDEHETFGVPTFHMDGVDVVSGYYLSHPEMPLVHVSPWHQDVMEQDGIEGEMVSCAFGAVMSPENSTARWDDITQMVTLYKQHFSHA